MAKGKIGKTFFEVYGSQPREGGTSGDKADKEKTPADFPTSEGEDVIVISDVADGLPEKEEVSGKGRAAAIIIGSVCGVGLAIGMFFLGHSIGKVETPRQEMAAEAPAAVGATVPKTKPRPPVAAKAERKRAKEAASTPSKPEKKPPEKAAAAPAVAPPPASADMWTLRVISYTDVQKNLEKAAIVADVLQSTTGHDAFVARFGNKLVVCLGEFNSKDNPELLELQKQIRAFEYEKKKQFISSYPVRLK
ncbi:MAG: hypothetical protein ACE5IC_04015 [Candidatus Brocadiales bacterium]